VLGLLILTGDTLSIDIEKAEIKNESDYTLFYSALNEIAQILSSKHYIVCPEFQPENAFIKNGEIV